MHRRRLALRALLVSWLASGVAVAAGCGGEVERRDPGPGPGTTAGGVLGWERLPDGPLSGRVGATVVGLDEHHALVVGGWQWLCPPTADCVWPDVPLLADGGIVDLRTGEWRAIADAPYGFRHAVGAAVAGQAYVWTACRNGRGCQGAAQLLRYDVAADRWLEAARPPAGRAPVSAGAGGWAAARGLRQ